MYTVNYTIYIKNVKRDFFLSIIISTIILNRFKKYFYEKLTILILPLFKLFHQKVRIDKRYKKWYHHNYKHHVRG